MATEVVQGGADFAAAMRVVGPSTALGALGGASALNISYIASENPTPHAIVKSRADFLEAGLISCASAVHNFVMTLIYGIAALLGQVDNRELNTAFKRSMLHLTISLASVGIGAVGAISPQYGARGTAGLSQLIVESGREITAFLN